MMLSMDLATSQRLLQSVGLFAGFSDEDIMSLARMARSQRYAPGATIVTEGEPGGDFYCIVSGRVEVRKENSAGDQVVLAALGPAEYFGEMALLESGIRSASVVAIDDTECLLLKRLEFLAEVRRHHDMALKMLVVLSKRLRNTNGALTE